MGSSDCWETTGRSTGCLTEGWDFEVVPASGDSCWLADGIAARCSLESPLELAPPLGTEMAPMLCCFGGVPLLGPGGWTLATDLGGEKLVASGGGGLLETAPGGFGTGLS